MEFKLSIPVVRPDEFVVKNFTGVNQILNGVSTQLTWEMKFNPTFYKPLVLVNIENVNIENASEKCPT